MELAKIILHKRAIYLRLCGKATPFAGSRHLVQVEALAHAHDQTVMLRFENQRLALRTEPFPQILLGGGAMECDKLGPIG